MSRTITSEPDPSTLPGGDRGLPSLGNTRMVGRSVRRLEDERLLRGAGRYVDDVELAGTLHLGIVRSQIAHGELAGIDASAALELPGVVAVFTGQELAELPPIPVRLNFTGDEFHDVLQPVLARDRVRYVGEPVAAVVAVDPYLADDAAELVEVDISPLDAVLDARTAGSGQAVHARGNNIIDLVVNYGDVDAALASVCHVVTFEASVGRHSAVPLETRGVLASWDLMGRELAMWGLTKVIHFNRRVLASMFDVPVNAVHVSQVDVGGGFGVRGELYPEDVVAAFVARSLGRPVKWIEDRSEHLVACNHSREQHHRMTVGLDADHGIVVLCNEVWHDNGAYLRTHGVTVPELTGTMFPGPYRVPAYRSVVHVTATNKTPCGTYRAPGRFEGTFARERMLDVVARELRIDPVELRRRNLLTAAELPCKRPMTALGTAVILDAADYPHTLDEAIRASGFDEWRDEATALRTSGRAVGVGLACVLEKSGLGPYETAAVEIDESGLVRVLHGGACIGQGIETVFGQIAAEVLGAPLSDVRVMCGDTDLVPDGVGSWASRSTVVGGSAVFRAAQSMRDRLEFVGQLCSPGGVAAKLKDGLVWVGDLSFTFAELAARSSHGPQGAPAGRSSLRCEAIFEVEHMTYPNAVHLAQVEVDRATYAVAVRKYHVSAEIGRAINPKLVRGQIMGGSLRASGEPSLSSSATAATASQCRRRSWTICFRPSPRCPSPRLSKSSRTSPPSRIRLAQREPERSESPGSALRSRTQWQMPSGRFAS